MRYKVLLVISLALGLCQRSQARLPDSWFFRHFSFGMEWGYTQCFWQSRNYNIVSEEGYRIYEKDKDLYFKANAGWLGQISFQPYEKLVLGLYGGYVGMGRDNRTLPLLLRASYFPHSAWEDGWFGFAQGGPAFHFRNQSTRQPWLVSAGAGWRSCLSYDGRIDLLVSVRYLIDHPMIPDPEGPGYVAPQRILKNNANCFALDISMAISF